MAKEASAHVGGSWTQVASEEVVEVDQEQGLELVPPFPRLLGAEGPQVLEASALLRPPQPAPIGLTLPLGPGSPRSAGCGTLESTAHLGGPWSSQDQEPGKTAPLHWH